MNVYKERISSLRDLMKDSGIDMYYILTDDYHGSEFVGDYFMEREFLSGFTGSAGNLIITNDKAGLFTDGRYFIQAEEELEGSGIDLYRLGVSEDISIEKFMQSNLSTGMTIAFNGKTIKASEALKYENILKEKSIKIVSDIDLPDLIWKNRPEISKKMAFELELKYSGEDTEQKIKRVRNYMNKIEADMFVLTALDDIAWLLNIRGNDVKCNPVLLSYMIITSDKVYLYCYKHSVINIMEYLNNKKVECREYNNIYSDLKEFCKNSKLKVIMDFDKSNYCLYTIVKNSNSKVIDVINPTTTFKAIKNQIEINNEKAAHIKDGVAMVKFLYWFKQNVGNESITELDAAEYLLKKREEQNGFIEESFEPIVAYGKHGAIVHYSPNKESNCIMKNKSFVLIDTGAHYYQGTTDITRTVACGELTEEEKKDFTLVLKGNLRLGATIFKKGICGANLDIIARMSLWEYGLDYNHGTGHGVGYLLNVHEGPNNIRYRFGSGKNVSCSFEEGMITSNEPGIYIRDKFGIRLENMILCVKNREISNEEYGDFLSFETLTLVPFDIEAIDVSLLDLKEIELLNQYHERVYTEISSYLSNEEKLFLRKITRKITKEND